MSRLPPIRGRAPLALAAALLLLGGPAVAAGPPAAARQLMTQGAAALSAGDLPTAQARYEAAYRLHQAPEILRELGKVARAQGRAVEAADLFRRYLRDPDIEPEAGADAAAREELSRIVREVSAETGEVAVQGEDGALVRVDDRVAGALPLSAPLLLSIGQHRISIEKERRRVQTQLKVLLNRPVQVRFTLVPPVALVSSTRAAVLVPEWAGADLGEAARQRLLRAAGRGAEDARVLVIPEERVAAALPGDKKAPMTAACLAEVACEDRLAASLEAHYALLLRTEATEGGLRLALQVRDLAAGPAGSSEATCAPCSAAQGERAVADLIGRALREVATRPRGALQVQTEPPGADLSIDGRAVGKTPQRRAAFAGEHEVALTLAGHRPYAAKVTVSGDGAEEPPPALLSVKLEALPPPPKPQAAPPPLAPIAAPVARAKPEPVYRKWWFWGALGLAAAAAGALAGGLAGGLAAGAQPPGREFINPRELIY
jgi:hypothetical protein